MASLTAQDLSLLRKYATAGDAGAFGELVRRYSDMVYATARRVTGDATIAEDVSQDCFLRLAQQSKSIRGSLAAWLHRTSLNRSLELRRADAARRRREIRAAADHHDTHADQSAARLIASVDTALASLPEELRVLVTEHYLCGRTEADLAEQAGVSQSTIHRKLDKALDELRRKLRDSDDEPEALAGLAPILIGCASEKAPESLQPALVKIGLSGFGVTTASAPVAWLTTLLKPASLLLIFALLATGSSVLYFSQRSASVPNGRHTFPFDQLPPAVQEVVRARVTLSPTTEIEKKQIGNRTVFDIDFDAGGKHHEMRIAEDGTVIWKKPP